jgi:hypothetical protein
LTNTDLEIEFTEKPDCAESSKWLMFVYNSTKLSCVGIGGTANYRGVETIGGKFNFSTFNLIFVSISLQWNIFFNLLLPKILNLSSSSIYQRYTWLKNYKGGFQGME